jgi:hypothetical protein
MAKMGGSNSSHFQRLDPGKKGSKTAIIKKASEGWRKLEVAIVVLRLFNERLNDFLNHDNQYYSHHQAKQGPEKGFGVWAKVGVMVGDN